MGRPLGRRRIVLYAHVRCARFRSARDGAMDDTARCSPRPSIRRRHRTSPSSAPATSVISAVCASLVYRRSEQYAHWRSAAAGVFADVAAIARGFRHRHQRHAEITGRPSRCRQEIHPPAIGFSAHNGTERMIVPSKRGSSPLWLERASPPAAGPPGTGFCVCLQSFVTCLLAGTPIQSE